MVMYVDLDQSISCCPPTRRRTSQARPPCHTTPTTTRLTSRLQNNHTALHHITKIVSDSIALPVHRVPAPSPRVAFRGRFPRTCASRNHRVLARPFLALNEPLGDFREGLRGTRCVCVVSASFFFVADPRARSVVCSQKARARFVDIAVPSLDRSLL